MKPCPDCNGDGVVDKDTDDEGQCPKCGGLGFVPDDDDDHEEVIKTSRDLPATNRRRQTMKSILGVSLLILLMPSAYAASLPGVSADGKRLYDANCMGCHDTSVLTRKDRVVQSLDALKKAVGELQSRDKKRILRERNGGPPKVLERSVLSFPLGSFRRLFGVAG
jgi:hypothetical protein